MLEKEEDLSSTLFVFRVSKVLNKRIIKLTLPQFLSEYSVSDNEM